MQSPLNLPPFPQLEWEDYRWVAPIGLAAWAEFRLADEEEEPEAAELGVETADEEPNAPSPAQVAAFALLLENGEPIREAILAELLAEYAQWQIDFGYDEAEKAELMPDVKTTDDFKPLLELTAINIFPAEKNGYAYIGVMCNCSWDPEHAFGAMVHRERVVEIGGADTAILSWIADKDAKAS